MKAEKLLHLILEENGYEEFVTKGSGFSQTIAEAMEEYASLKVAEATLPNVKDWDDVYKKFKENYKNSEHILHPINFLSWLKQHYSTPLSASEQSPHTIVK